jgi:hypothetical protein
MSRGFLRLFCRPELAVLDQPLANSATFPRPGARRGKPQFSEISSLESVATPSKWESNRVRKSRRSILRARPSFIRLDCRRTTSATSNRNPLPPFAGLPCRFCRRSPRRLWGRSLVSDRARRVRVSFPLASARSFRPAWSNLIVFGSDLFAQRSMA